MLNLNDKIVAPCVKAIEIDDCQPPPSGSISTAEPLCCQPSNTVDTYRRLPRPREKPLANSQFIQGSDHVSVLMRPPKSKGPAAPSGLSLSRYRKRQYVLALG
jgi:hypothetical protein